LTCPTPPTFMSVTTRVHVPAERSPQWRIDMNVQS
jgi:hypothetical protein